ncbi:epimerase [Taibaiella sp. KBW10]|uniref:NAD-dependent epimerase/dehydratase family protein n=1 Tax=Taibaiella sp. KBW10 TaxID=2153357 RepID=UPI000F5A25F0|nr:NAD-dependent epimerase/dehydratase family protein [Taibaiella sp. KBW10]RQO29711.1 epimerase [Taibaiella sp. KBW10]
MGNTVLVTGASGLLGANVVRYLYDAGYQIKVLVRSSANLSALADVPFRLCYGSIDDQATVDQAVSGCDYVVHAASLTTQWGVSYEEYKAINVEATKFIAQACLKHKVKKLIYISTANTLGPGSLQQPGTELNAFSLHHLNSGYINSKYIALQYIQEQVQQQGLPAVTISPTFMIGKYDIKPSSGQLLLHGLNKKVLVYPPGGKNFVHVTDVCQGIHKAMLVGQVGEVYLLAGHNLTYKDFFQKLRTQTAQSGNMFKAPKLLLQSLGRIGSLYRTVSRRQVKLDYAAAYMLCLDNYYSGAKASRDLDIQYQSIDTAIEDALSWFRQNNYC